MTNTKIKEAIENAIRHFSELNDARNQVIINSLDSIDTKLTSQNGSIADALSRVAAVEKDIQMLEIICPHRKTITELVQHKNEIEAIKKYVRNWVILATAIANSAIGTILFILMR
jgi:dihydroorotate dehydrogenase